MNTDELLRHLENMRGKYIKQILTRLELAERTDSTIRKIVLDEINNLFRELLPALGYTVED